MTKENKITLDGDLSIKNASEVYQHLIKATDHDPCLQVVVSKPSDIDLTTIQLLLATQKQVKQVGVSFQLPDELNELLIRAGFKI